MATSPDRAALRRPYYQRRYLRLALGIAFTTVLMGVFVIYPPLRMAWYALPGWQPGTLAVLAVSVVPVLIRLAHELKPGIPARVASAIALTWLGLGFMFAPVLALVDLVNGFVLLPRPATGYALLGLAGLVAAIGFMGAQRLHVRTLQIAGGGRARGRLVQISDVHIGSRLPGLLRRVVDLANAQRPDVHLITGDLIDFKDIGVAELAPLGELNAPAYFVIGNHERYVDLEPICERLRALGIRVLRNESETCGDFHLLGIDDAEDRRTVERTLPRLARDPERFQVLLYHRPDGFEAAAEAGIDLMLTGHTHHGQIIPFNFIVARVFKPMAGLHERNGTHLYVSPGTGTWGPVLRIGSRSEITVFEIG